MCRIKSNACLGWVRWHLTTLCLSKLTWLALKNPRKWILIIQCRIFLNGRSLTKPQCDDVGLGYGIYRYTIVNLCLYIRNIFYLSNEYWSSSVWSSSTLRWRHNKCDVVSNHRRSDCLLNRLFRRRSKRTSTLCVTGLCEGNSLVTGAVDAPHKGPVTRKMAPFHDVIMMPWWVNGYARYTFSTPLVVLSQEATKNKTMNVVSKLASSTKL